MKKIILSFIFIIFVSIIFYIVCPKYHFIFNYGLVRCNKITGTVEMWSRDKQEWIMLKYKKPNLVLEATKIPPKDIITTEELEEIKEYPILNKE